MRSNGCLWKITTLQRPLISTLGRPLTARIAHRDASGICWRSASTSAASSLSLRSDLSSLCDHSPALCCVQILMPKHADSLEAVCAAAARTAQDQDASVVMLVTETGEAPRMTAKYRPRVPIVACCPNEVRYSGRDLDTFAELCVCLWLC